jgi:hypothetical protein
MNQSKNHLITFYALLVFFTSTASVHAWFFITGKFSPPFNQCQTCHISSSNLAMNPYGDDYMDPTHRDKYASKHPAIAVSGDCNICHSGKGYPILRSGLGAMDSDLDLFSNDAEFSAGTFPGDGADFPMDSHPPIITAFSLPAISNTLIVIISSLTASDDVGVAGYLLNESGVAPAADGAGWSATAPTQYAFATAGIHTLYAWAKDAAGNVSVAASAQVDNTPSQYRVNAPPVASAGADQTVIEGQAVLLDGGGSTDDLGIFNYAWLQLDGSGGVPISADDPDAVVISDPFGASMSFVTPVVDINGAALTFQLTVTDGDGVQDSVEVTVTVEDNGITVFDGLAGVISTFSADGQPVGIGNTGANACIFIKALGSQDVAGGWQQPKDALYGFIDFELKVVDPGQTSVTIFLPSPAPTGYKWYKYTAAGGWFDFSRELISNGTGDGAAFNADRTQVTLYITDNGEYDDNPTPDVISDPGGLASGLSSTISVGSNSFSGSGGGCFINTSVDGPVAPLASTIMTIILWVGALAGGGLLLTIDR